MELRELKAIVRCCAQDKGGRILLLELDKEFKKIVGRSLKDEAHRLRFSSIPAMIHSWPDFVVDGMGAGTSIHIKKVDHVFEMNRRSKNFGKKRGTGGFKSLYDRREARLPLIGKDPYAFSSDTQSEHSSDEWDLVPQQKPAPKKPVIPQTSAPKQPSQHIAPEKPSSPATNRSQTSSLKVAVSRIPPCRPIENIKELQTIIFLDQISPHRFWFAEHSQSKKILQMMKEMTSIYEKEGDRLKMRVKDVHVDQFVATKFYSMWHRARVVKVMPGHLRILYVDYGTTKEVPIGSVRYLLEDFTALPAAALRGVLSHVQPTNGEWCDESKEYFYNYQFQKKIDTKILKRDESQNCYFVAIKLTTNEPGHPKRLLTELMIEKNFCTVDSDFLTKENYTSEQDFEFYERGDHLKDPPEEQVEWLPVPITQAPANDKDEEKENWLPDGGTPEPAVPSAPKSLPKSSGASAATLPSARTSFSFSRLAEIRSRAAPVIHRVTEQQTDLQKLSTISSACTSSSISEQSLKVFKVGSVFKVHINFVVDHRNFYFHLKDEFAEIWTFLDTFDEIMRDGLSSCTNFAIGAEVATYEDENYCRGRIVDHVEDRNLFKVFLVDYGTTVYRTEMELFKLSDNFKNRQPAVYKGSLANLPEHVHIKTKEQLIARVSGAFLDARVVRVEDNTVELLLLE